MGGYVLSALPGQSIGIVESMITSAVSFSICLHMCELLARQHCCVVFQLEPCTVQEYPMFHTSDGRKVIENLDEFDDAREVVAGLAAEYQACERPDYVSLVI